MTLDGGLSDSSTIDASLPLNPIISATRLVSVLDDSFVDIDVDWHRQLAYVSSRETAACLYVVDFSNELTPTIVRILGAADGTGGRCLGSTISETGQHLFLTSWLNNQLEYWRLDDDPREATRISALTVNYPRDVVFDEANHVLYVIQGQPTPGFSRIDIAGDGSLSLIDSYALPLCNLHYNGAALLRGSLLTGCADDNSPAEIIDAASLTSIDSIDMSHHDLSDFWTASSFEEIGFLGGWVSGFFEFDMTLGRAVLASRFDNAGGYRDSAFVRRDATRLLFAVGSFGYVDVFDASLPRAPRLVSRTHLMEVESELYGVAIHADSRRALLVTNRSQFIIVDIDRLEPATMDWPSY